MYDEICSVVGEGDVSTNQMKDLKLSEACIKEAMRLAPPVPHITRKVPENCTIGEFNLLFNEGCYLAYVIIFSRFFKAYFKAIISQEVTRSLRALGC